MIHYPFSRFPATVKIWLFIGVGMVFIQIVLGGITRLTDSGLSITEWAVIQGTIPPLTDTAWVTAFDQYKIAAKKQYESIHSDMTLSEFKVIFYWEYFHRLWARMMGFIFLFPFLYFTTKLSFSSNFPFIYAAKRKMIPKWLMKRLGITIGLAVIVATFGWIMVASGLNDDTRTWVSAYKLVGHLILATILFGYLLWTWFLANQPTGTDQHLSNFKKLAWIITSVLLCANCFWWLNGWNAGGLAPSLFSVFYRRRPIVICTSGNYWRVMDYEASAVVKAVVQLIHRATAYLLSGLVIYFFIKLKKVPTSERLKKANYFLLAVLLLQFLLGVLTVVNSFGRIPIVYGALHQAGALLLLAVLLYINFQLKEAK